MLDHFSQEVILQINDHISFYAKLSLALCCCRLYSKLYNNSLFENLQILSKNKEAVVELFKEKNFDTSRIKTVQTTSSTQEISKSTGIFSSLTNVQEIFVDNPYLYNVAQFGPLEGFSYLKDTIQKHDNLHGLPIITQLLKMYTFPHLTSLYLDNYTSNQTDTSLVCLVNAPNLVSVKLNNCKIFIGYLEMLHQRYRHLQSLNFGGGTFGLIAEQYPETIFPADELTFFGSTLSIINDESCKFIHYIIDKYPNLTTLETNGWLDMPRLHAGRGNGNFNVSNTHRAYREHLPGLMMELVPRLHIKN
jgi:hypothetical protein